MSGAEAASSQLDLAVKAGRYAELYDYDDYRDELYLEAEPESA